MTLQEKIDLAEEESNDMKKIEAEKQRLDGVSYTARPLLYKEPETIIERAKRWIRDVFMDTCECGGVFYDWSAKKSVCDRCGRVK